MAWMLACLLLVQDPVSKDEILKLAREGATEEALVKRVGTARFTLTADEIVELKKAGASEKVILLMTRAGLKVTNGSQKTLYLVLQDGTLDVNFNKGDEVRQEASTDLPASGEVSITVEGRKTTFRAKVPATLTFRGCDTAQMDLLTLLIEDASGSRTCLLDLKGKAAPERPDVWVRRGPPSLEGFWGPRHTLFPFVSDSMIIGAAAGAIIGHQSGHRTRGALIGAGAGALFDLLHP